MKKLLVTVIVSSICCLACIREKVDYSKPVVLGVERPEIYLPIVEGKRVGLLSNSTAVCGEENELSLDYLLRQGVNITTIFSPEHGFRGFADAGEAVPSKVDEPTGIYISSLFESGESDKVGGVERLDSVDVIVVDIQDIGLRYFTYYISMMEMMNLAIEQNKEFIVLDRPNPNGSYVDGPILDMRYKSGVGAIPIPIVHGLTLGEMATMINEEGWLKDGRHLENLHIVECRNYDHQRRYYLPVKCGPNIRTQHAVYLYPSVCFFEGTIVSLGRGTELSFEVFGHPDLKDHPSIKDNFHFTPLPISGAKHPKYEGQACYGRDLRVIDDEKIIKNGVDLSYVIEAYKMMGAPGDSFFTPWFENLIGRDYVRKMIIEGVSATEIKECWANDVERFKQLRRKYLRYEE